jgi:REP element-mobilizing transposase RayT
LHHIICRGIERRRIFWEDSDREDFIQRLETILGATQTACYAWALLPNHFHLLLRTGNRPIAGVMRQLLSGYAGRFNRLHRRSGHLFQNRYKSILCQEEPYLLELVRYIQSVLSAQEERLEARYLLQSQGYDFAYALRRVAQLSGVEAEQILKAGKQPARLYARSLLCH